MEKNNDHDFEYAFHELYLQYSGKVYNFILKHSNGNTYLAEEVLQTVFMKIWERRYQFDDLSLLHPYLFAMVRNTFYKMCAHEAVKFAYEKCMKEEAEIADDTADWLDEEQLCEAVLKLAEKMPERRRKVFLKNRVEHKSYTTIAEEMNISEKTVGTHMTMALRYLREHLQDYASQFIIITLITNLMKLW